MHRAAAALFLLFAASCGSGASEIVPLLTAAGIPLTLPATVPLEVVTRSTAVRDPLPLRSTGIVYGDVEAALGHAISSSTVPWAASHRKAAGSKDGWQLFVEVINADAQYEAGRVIFSVGVRATLRSRAGNVYLAQTQTSCRQGGIVQPDKGAPIMYRCMMEVGHDLAGWLEGVDLDAVATSK
ncbi:MAG TPA: hypothetical protein VGI39_26440 [Polyangiaceae bacterium]|jgi:hypothetical protein